MKITPKVASQRPNLDKKRIKHAYLELKSIRLKLNKVSCSTKTWGKTYYKMLWKRTSYPVHWYFTGTTRWHDTHWQRQRVVLIQRNIKGSTTWIYRSILKNKAHSAHERKIEWLKNSEIRPKDRKNKLKFAHYRDFVCIETRLNTYQRSTTSTILHQSRYLIERCNENCTIRPEVVQIATARARAPVQSNIS